MKKMIYILAAIVLLLGFFFGIIPLFINIFVAGTYQQELASLQKYYPKSHITAKLVKKGWYSSKIEFSYDGLLNNHLTGFANIQYGPLVISSHGVNFGMAQIAGGQINSSLYGKVNFSGSMSYLSHLHIDATLATPNHAIKALMGPHYQQAKVHVKAVSVKFSTLDLFKGLKIQTTLKQINVLIHKTKNVPDMTYHVARVATQYLVSGLKSHNAVYTESLRASGVEFEARGFRYHIKHFNIADVHSTRSRVEQFLKHYESDIQILNVLNAALKQSPHNQKLLKQRERVQFKVLNQSISFFCASIQNDTTFNLKGGSFKVPYGAGSFGGSLSFYGIHVKHPLTLNNFAQHSTYQWFITMPTFRFDAPSKGGLHVRVNGFAFKMTNTDTRLSLQKATVTQQNKLLGHVKKLSLTLHQNHNLKDYSVKMKTFVKLICVRGQCFKNSEFEFGLKHINYQNVLKQNFQNLNQANIQKILHQVFNKHSVVTSRLNVGAPLGEVAYRVKGTFKHWHKHTALQKALALQVSMEVPQQYVDMLVGPYAHQTGNQGVNPYSVSISPFIQYRLNVMRQSWSELGYLKLKNGQYHLVFNMEPNYQFTVKGQKVSPLIKAAALINMGFYHQAKVILDEPQYRHNRHAMRMKQAIVVLTGNE